MQLVASLWTILASSLKLECEGVLFNLFNISKNFLTGSKMLTDSQRRDLQILLMYLRRSLRN